MDFPLKWLCKMMTVKYRLRGWYVVGIQQKGKQIKDGVYLPSKIQKREQEEVAVESLGDFGLMEMGK